MHLEKFTVKDIVHIPELQPDGWSDITNDITGYITNDFCFPYKAVINDRIVGMGALIIFGKTGWLAHVIVKNDYRNQGIGFAIVNDLLNIMKSKGVESVQLIATKMGESVYLKRGFRITSEYGEFRTETTISNEYINPNIIKTPNKYYNELYNLDRQVTGENRELLIKMYLANSYVYVKNNMLSGYYLPDLGEGTIVADHPATGIEFMKSKYTGISKAVVPYENIHATGFLLNKGFKDMGIKGKRMILGKEVRWDPMGIFSRIGGNYG